jgi:hypothetical protein
VPTSGRVRPTQEVVAVSLAPYIPIVVLFALGFGFALFSVVVAGLTGRKR